MATGSLAMSWPFLQYITYTSFSTQYIYSTLKVGQQIYLKH